MITASKSSIPLKGWENFYITITFTKISILIFRSFTSLFQAFRLWSASENYSERKSGSFYPALLPAIFFARAPLSERLEQASK